MNKPGPKPKPEHEKMHFMAGRVPHPAHKAAKAFREARGWTESDFIRYAVDVALRTKPPKRLKSTA